MYCKEEAGQGKTGEETIEPLLTTKERVSETQGNHTSTSGVIRRTSLSWKAILTYTGILALYTSLIATAAVTWSRKSVTSCPSGTSLGRSPAADYIRWETRPLDGFIDSVYAGKPSSELDDAWHVLLQNMALRILPDEARELNLSSLALADGSGYVGMLGVYHQLHCLKRIRWWLYKDHYYADEPFDPIRFDHVDHCVELLRQAATCQSNVDIVPFEWRDTDEGPRPAMQTGTIHRCVDWNALQEWASTRRVDLFDQNVLMRPTPHQGHDHV